MAYPGTNLTFFFPIVLASMVGWTYCNTVEPSLLKCAHQVMNIDAKDSKIAAITARVSAWSVSGAG